MTPGHGDGANVGRHRLLCVCVFLHHFVHDVAPTIKPFFCAKLTQMEMITLTNLCTMVDKIVHLGRQGGAYV